MVLRLLMFDDRTINVLAYNMETILAEKLETVLSRNIANTRPRDFYDIYILYSLHGDDCDIKKFREALMKTTDKRGSQSVMNNYQEIIIQLRNSNDLRRFWNKYQSGFEYARGISFDYICDKIQEIMDIIMQ